MILVPFLVAAAAVLTPDQQADLTCVVTLARARPVPAGASDFAVTVGAALMDGTGRTREQVRDLMLAQAARPAIADTIGCTERMRARNAAEAADEALPEPSATPARRR